MSPSDDKPSVIVIGGGFAGLAAVQSLKRADVRITLIDRRNHHLFQPLLYQVATGELSPSNIASPLRSILNRQPNAQVLLGEVTDISLADQQVQMNDQALHYDYLIVAAGSSHHYFGNDHWSELAPGLKTVENATEIRRRILTAFETAERCQDPVEVAEQLTFVIVGAGPTGCELAGAIAEVAFHSMARDFRSIDPQQTRVVLIEPSENPMHFYPPPLPQRTHRDLTALGVEVLCGYHVKQIEPTEVVLSSTTDLPDKTIRTRTVVWAAGVQAVPMGETISRQAGVERKRSGRVVVGPDVSIEGHSNVFVCGDLASLETAEHGELPCLAPVASQMGRHAGRCIIADAKGKPRKPFHYFDRGSLAVIGRYRAVGTIRNFKVQGFVAWFLWLFVHLMYITRFRNRILVLVQWGWTFLTRDRSSRLITNAPSTVVERPVKKVD
ncbi:NAD(P)/FAD-dependent oxidoreductase [Stieleria sp. TO1_6]|uniref:NAD(P)/FAD-dependent oxidoreductase n=1 Tax=Stieleria tagensis TaxID=2956795 RepID=UPI00209B99B5|nr:NAD(P)/FAD-dependent oxidoreductase [Stieleria tagensis]MCO8121637.1 NAD(P)/FAD-dependent oxidoreductase [Stieleria tagensis]